MDTVRTDQVEKTAEGMEVEFLELGRVSEETRGSIFGGPDGGAGNCFC
jgi:hypothetical protein